MFLSLLIFLSCIAISKTARLSDFAAMEVEIGKEVLGPDLGQAQAGVDQATIQKILDGVKMGNRESIYFYALYKLHGIGLSKNQTIAALNFERAAGLGHKEATTAAGVLRLHGQGIEKDHGIALNYFRKAVALGDINAHWFLGKCLFEGLGVLEPQHDEAYQHFSLAASHDVPQAEHYLGIMHEYGLGTLQSFERAFEFYKRASGQHHVESTYHLALMHAFGRGTPQNFKAAAALFDNGARNNHAPSVYYMGIVKLYGYGCEPNYEQAVNWFERAAGMGDLRVENEASSARDETKRLMAEAETAHQRVIDSFDTRNSVP